MNAILTRLSAELDQMFSKIDKEDDMDPANATGLALGLAKRSAWLARSAEIIAVVQREVDRTAGEQSASIYNDPKGPPPATYMKELLRGNMADENAVQRKADRLNATITHQMEALRTLISLAKTEMQNM